MVRCCHCCIFVLYFEKILSRLHDYLVNFNKVQQLFNQKTTCKKQVIKLQNEL